MCFTGGNTGVDIGLWILGDEGLHFRVVAGKWPYFQPQCAQGCPVNGVGRQLRFSPAGAHVSQSFWAAATAPRRWLQWPGLQGTPTVIDVMGKGVSNCHHPFTPASPYGRGELAVWLYASHGRYHLPLHCLLVGYGWSGAAVFQCRVPEVPGYRISGRPELKTGGRKTSPQHAPVSIVNLLLGMNVLLDSHLRGEKDGGEKGQVRNQGFLFIALSGESCWTPVFLSAPTSVGNELPSEKGETVLAVSLEYDLHLSAITSALQEFNLRSYSLSKS